MTHKECDLMLSFLIQENPKLKVKYFCKYTDFDGNSYEVNYRRAPKIQDIYYKENSNKVYFEYEQLEEELMDNNLSKEEVKKIIVDNYKIMRCIVVVFE